jgi:hypothetical protein
MSDVAVSQVAQAIKACYDHPDFLVRVDRFEKLLDLGFPVYMTLYGIVIVERLSPNQPCRTWQWHLLDENQVSIKTIGTDAELVMTLSHLNQPTTETRHKMWKLYKAMRCLIQDNSNLDIPVRIALEDSWDMLKDKMSKV